MIIIIIIIIIIGQGWATTQNPILTTTDGVIIRSVFIILNRKGKYVAYESVLSQISNCQGLGRKNKHDFLKTDRNNNNNNNSNDNCNTNECQQ